VRGISVGGFDINRSPDSRDRDNLTSPSSQKFTHRTRDDSPVSAGRDNLTSPSSQKFTHRTRDDSPVSAGEGRHRHAETMPTESKPVPETKHPVASNSEEEEFFDPHHQLTTEDDVSGKDVSPPASAKFKVSQEDYDDFIKWKNQQEKLTQAKEHSAAEEMKGEED